MYKLICLIFLMISCSDESTNSDRRANRQEKTQQIKQKDKEDTKLPPDSTTPQTTNTKKVELVWTPNNDKVTGYSIYAYVDDLNTKEKIADISTEDTNFEKANPKKQISLDSKYNDKNICFLVSAKNKDGESELSEESCIQL